MTDQVNSVTLQEEWNAVNPNGTTPVAPSDKKKETGFDPFHFDPDMVKHLTYEYIVMRVLDAVGISQVSDDIKKTADLQKLEDTIHSIVNKVSKIIQNLSNATPKDASSTTGDQYAVDWGKFYSENKADLDALKSDWKDLFGTGGSTESYMAQWKTMLGKDSDNPAYNMVNDLNNNGISSVLGSSGFTDWLKGTGSLDDLSKAFGHAYYTTHEHNDSTWDPSKHGGKSRPTEDPLAATTSAISSTASTVGGLTNSNSTQLTQDSQELTSYVQIGQKILSTTDSLKSDMARNQRQ